MQGSHKKLLSIFTVAIALLILGNIVKKYYNHEHTHSSDTQIIQKTINEQQEKLHNAVTEIDFKNLSNSKNTWALMDSLSTASHHFFVFKDSIPIAWSTNSIPLKKLPSKSTKLIQLGNGWYLCECSSHNKYTILGLSLIKHQYQYENKFLNNRFTKAYQLTHQPTIVVNEKNSDYLIHDTDENYLMSLVYSHHQVIPSISVAIFIIYILCFVLLAIGLIKAIEYFKSKPWINFLLLLVFALLMALSFLFNKYAIPQEFIHSKLFSPLTFAVSDWLSSLGSLFSFSVAMIFFAYCFFRYYKTSKLGKLNNYIKIGYSSFLILLVMVGFIFLNDLTRLIVSNSSQATIFFNIEDLNTVALFKVLILVNFYIAIVKIFDRIIVCIKANTSFTHFLIISVSLYVLLFLISLLGEYTVHPFNLLIFLITGVILYYGHRNNFNELSYSSFIWIVLSISLYIVYFLYSYNVKKEAINRELLIENLSFQLTKEADPIAEMYLSEMEGKIKDDEKLIKMLLQSNDNEQEITSYLEKTYFYGYWKRYDIEVVVCWSNADLFIESENITTNCYSYFDELIQNQGSKANECEHFYFLDNDNGQVSYFGKIPFMQGNPDLETTLYCEINSTPTFSGLGYPELLKDQEEHANLTLFKNYSFAKYIDNKLVKQIGNYRYPIKFNSEVIKINEKKLYEDEDILHLLYKPNEKTTLILSRPSIKLIFLLMSFSSFALLFFFISWMLRFITRSYKTNSIFTHSIQERIQIALVGLMIVILLIMGVSSVFYSIHQFKEKNNQMLSQRIKSVLQEMEQKIVNEEKLDESMQDYLQYLMQKFSNVFFSDINLYDLDGKLLATSRPELYQQNLTGRMMNTQAYNELYYKQKTEYIHDEYIGKLHFTSAYVPIYNYNHEILAFLNLPYFVGNNELKSEVSSLIVAVINAYLLFILFGIGVAVIVSRRITRPLILIQDRLAQIRIDKQNKKIGYKGNDEIGNLVKEYNRMVDEISDSAEELAKSQREMAWREMAKQIAHEIKNPLTPMKLSVQYLTKAWDTQREDFDSFLKRVSKTLIEQIDQLHSIANEFSNFAKMPVPERTKIDITSKVTNTASLFEKSEPNIHFALNISSEKHFIYADNDQMLSVLNNIIKNAVQSIPSNRKGQISINLKKDNEDVLISISDNGRGMNEEVKSKIFMPNFTTKSSGMGLGLAIVKNIVNNSSGKIWFETNENIGTTFYIKFPLFKDA